MVDRLDPGQVVIVSGEVTANAGTGTFVVGNAVNEPILTDDRDVREVLTELWKAVYDLRKLIKRKAEDS